MGQQFDKIRALGEPLRLELLDNKAPCVAPELDIT